MEERTVQVAGQEVPMAATGAGSAVPAAPGSGPPHLEDARALTILTTEHWSLLSARSLVYNEAFARGGMFMTFLTGSLVALGFVSQGTGFTREFLVVAAALLAFDLLIGLVTLGRIMHATAEEFRALQGMARLRHAYFELVPGVVPYFSTSAHDDMAGILEAFGPPAGDDSALTNLLHGLTTTPGLVGLICSIVAGALAAAVVLLAGGSAVAAILGGIGGALGLFVVVTFTIVRAMGRHTASLEIRFPRHVAGPGGGP